jgi:hypothetical protein
MIETVSGTLFNGTTCDPALKWQYEASPVNYCISDPPQGGNDDYLIGGYESGAYCSSSSAFPVQSGYDWVLQV